MASNAIHHAPGSAAVMAYDEATVQTGMSFLVGQLEKWDAKIVQPITNITWARDIYPEPGGGWVDYSSAYFASYASSGTNEDGLIAGETNTIPIIQATVGKDIYKIHTWSNAIVVPFQDEQRMQQSLGQSLTTIFQTGLQISYETVVNKNVYTGFPSQGTYGIVNNPEVTASLAPIGGGSQRTWKGGKTPTEILADLNSGIGLAWANTGYADDGLPNQMLLPPAQFNYIATTPVTTAGSQSILSFFKANNIVTGTGQILTVVPCRQCIGEGLPLTTGGAGTDRMVVYQNREDRMSFDMPIPIQRTLTQPSVMHGGYLTGYIAKFGQVKFKFYQVVNYLDGI